MFALLAFRLSMAHTLDVFEALYRGEPVAEPVIEPESPTPAQ